MAHTDKQKIQILMYAKENGVMNAARYFGIPCPTLCTWNAQFKIYENSQANYNRTKKVAEQYSEEEKIQILNFAKDYGLGLAQKKYNVGRYIMARWNEVYNVYVAQKHVRYTEKQKIEILEHAAIFGRSNAVKTYNVTYALLGLWNTKYNICTPGRKAGKKTIKKPCKISTAQQIEILEFAKKHGRMMATVKYNISTARLRAWNKKHQILPVSKKLSADEITRVVACAKQFGISDAARRFNMAYAHVRYLVQKRQERTK